MLEQLRKKGRSFCHCAFVRLTACIQRAYSKCQQNLVERLDPVSTLLSGSDIILPTSSINLTILATQGVKRGGVAADGTARLVIRFNAPNVGRVSFSLVDQNGSALLSHQEDGTLSTLQNSQSDSFTVNTNATTQGHKAFALYTAPRQFVRPNFPGDADAISRQVFIHMIYSGSGGDIE